MYEKAGKDLTGLVFGKLLVLEISDITKPNLYGTHWICRCECGNVKTCGCSKKNKLPVGEASFRNIYRQYKEGAKSRELDLELQEKEFRYFISLDCYYCGISSINSRIGLDRIDSNKGYTMNNVVPCCKNCNYAKSSMSYDEFKIWIKRISDHMLSKDILYAR